MPTEKPSPSLIAFQLAAAIEHLDQAVARLLFKQHDHGLLSKVNAEYDLVKKYCDALSVPEEPRESLATRHADLANAVMREEDGGDVPSAVAAYRAATERLRDLCIVVLNGESGPDA